MTEGRILGGLWGVLVGDALGVPVEFMSRTQLQENPVAGIREFGTHCQPRGTWSDDGALTLCTVESLVNHTFDTTDMAESFVRWMNEGFWTATGEVFDIGNATRNALSRIAGGVPAEKAGGRDDDCNGNGSLMRIIPVVLRFAEIPLDSFIERIDRVSAITHGHSRSRMACVFYGLIIRQLLHGLQACDAVDMARAEFTAIYQRSTEFTHFRSLLEPYLNSTAEKEISSSGYVLDTLRASIWCLLTTDSFCDCVLRAVNLGVDTDTTGCVSGGLGGVTYGLKSIPIQWIDTLPRTGDVTRLFEQFCQCCRKG